MSTFKQCQRRWRFRYVTRLPDPPGRPAVLGTFVHRAAELLYQEASWERTLPVARELARKAWAETAASEDFDLLAPSEADQQAMRWEGWRLIERLWRLENPEKVRVLSTERRIEATVAGVPFLGIVDRLDELADGHLAITDYKTGKTKTDPVQLLLYAEAVGAADGARPGTARFYFLKDRIVQVRVNALEQRKVVKDLVGTWAAIAKACADDKFPPKTGPLCGWCPYADRCPEGTAYLRERFAAGRLRRDAPAAALIGFGVKSS